MARDIYAISYKMRKELYQRITRIIIAIFLSILIVNLLLTFVFFPVRNVSAAMEPDVPAGSFIFVTPLDLNPERGDVFLIQDNQRDELSVSKRVINSVASFVTFRQWKPFSSDNNFDAPHVRRIVGMPGDTIYIDRYDVYIMPQGQDHYLTEFELTESAYNVNFVNVPVDWDQSVGVKGVSEKITLGEDEYFVLGDNRTSCSDSRLWGSVKKDQLQGKAVLQYFPFDKICIF